MSSSVLALTPFGGRGALGGFGLLGLLGLGPLFFRRKGGGVVLDERDQEISRRSLLVAYTVFWLVFVAACVSLPAFYGWGGSVPVFVVQSSVFVACDAGGRRVVGRHAGPVRPGGDDRCRPGLMARSPTRSGGCGSTTAR